MRIMNILKRISGVLRTWLLMTAARIRGPIGGKKVGIQSDRMKKLMVSTNISGAKIKGMDYKFHYTLEKGFKDWFEDCNKDGLFRWET